MATIDFSQIPSFSSNNGISSLRLFLNKLTKDKVFLQLSKFDMHEMFQESPAECAKVLINSASKNIFYTEIYAFISAMFFERAETTTFQTGFLEGLRAGIKEKLCSESEKELVLTQVEKYHQIAGVVKFACELFVLIKEFQIAYIDEVVHLIDDLTNPTLRRNFLMICYIILGSIWVGRESIRRIFSNYENSLEADPSCTSLYKWCTLLRESGFDRTPDNKRRYLEVYRILFGVIEPDKDFNLWFIYDDQSFL